MQNKSIFNTCVHCITYNHSSYILDAFNGFTKQKTTFPFVCTIIDDASTDGEQDIIREYVDNNFDLSDSSIVRKEETDDYCLTFARHKSNLNCYFAVVYLKYNHQSKKKNKLVYISEWLDNAEYKAWCEGDDYWTDPLKLQKQVTFLESHPDYTMVCNRTKLYSESKKKYVGENYCYNQSQDVSVRDIIYRGGLFISTCSLIHRTFIANNKPEYWKKCGAGDYPLQIMAAMKGKVYYMNDMMSVYRVQNSASWMGHNKQDTLTKGKMDNIKSRVNMLLGFGEDYPQYKNLFQNKSYNLINSSSPYWNTPKSQKKQYIEFFSNYIKDYSFKWKLDLWIHLVRIPKIRAWYSNIFNKKYLRRDLYY